MHRVTSAASESRPPAWPVIMPPLDPAEYAALREDITTRGVLVAVEVDTDGQILDGHHRVAICEDLGIGYPRVVRAGLSHEQKIAHAVALNLARRHLSPEARAETVAALRAQGWSTRKISRQSGISQSTVVRDLHAGDPDGSPAVVVGVDGKRYAARRPRQIPSVYASTAREQERAQTALTALGDTAPDKILDLRRAERLTRDARSAARRVGPPVTLPPSVRIEHADFRHLDVEPGSVDLICTDPPYRAEDFRSGLWTDLAERAGEWLRPGGLLVAYTGQMHLPAAITALSQRLEFHWLYAIIGDRGTGTGQVRQRNLGTAWKPALAYRAPGGPDLPPWSVDVIQGAGRAKTTGHPWEQGVSEAEQILAALTGPGDLIFDPFLGSGTTAVAAVRLGRQVIGCDIDPAHLATARHRVAEAVTARTMATSREKP